MIISKITSVYRMFLSRGVLVKKIFPTKRFFGRRQQAPKNDNTTQFSNIFLNNGPVIRNSGDNRSIIAIAFLTYLMYLLYVNDGLSEVKEVLYELKLMAQAREDFLREKAIKFRMEQEKLANQLKIQNDDKKK